MGGSATPGWTSVSNVSAISSALHPNRADLADAVATRGEPGRLEVEDDELGVLDQRRRRCAPSASPTRAPRQASRASPSTTSARSEWASVAGARSSAKSARAASSGDDRAAARVDELDEAVGGVERELHRRSTVYEHMFVFKAKRKAAARGGLSQSSVSESR